MDSEKVRAVDVVFKNAAREQVLSPWVTLVTRTVSSQPSPSPQEFHSFKLADYVSTLPITKDGAIVLVRQYRPVLDRYTLELPSGLLDRGEDPLAGATRELFEETGCRAASPLRALGSMSPDTGRLENRLWAFVALDVKHDGGPGWKPDRAIESLVVPGRDFRKMITDGAFDHALHLAVIAQALIRGHLTW